MKLYYSYDKDADTVYFSKGKPSSKDHSEETSDDVVLRVDQKTKEIRGFTILNFTKRTKGSLSPIQLPIEAELVPA